MNALKEKLMLLKLKFRASKTKVFACFILFTIFSFVGLSLFPVKISADNNYINIYKTARNITAGENNWQKTINANPGDKIAFSIRVDASGSYNVYNINVSDNLPGQLSYASGSTKIDGNFASDGIVSGGINIGTIYINQSKIITFEAYVSNSSQYYGNTLTNTAYAKADNATQQSDSAQIYIGNNNPQSASLNIYKTVRNISRNENSWQKTTSANSGDRLAFQLQISTNNNATANNAVATDNLPSQLSYASGTTRIDNNYSASDSIVSSGLFVGSISPGQTKIITFEATMVSGYSYYNTSALTNYAYVKAENVSQTNDSAQIFADTSYQYPYQYQTGIRYFNIAIRNFSFDPDNLTIRKGDRVTFVNNDSVAHTITAPAFGGQHILQPNQSYILNTDNLQAIQYNYQCDFHPFMQGTLLVMDQAPLPPAIQQSQPFQPQQQIVIQQPAIRVVAGADNILFNGATAAAASGLAIIILYLLMRYWKRFTGLRLDVNLIVIKMKEKSVIAKRRT